MSEEKILNKYIELINKGYCCACNELNCIDNFPQKKIANAISNLQQENQQLKEVIEEVREYIDNNTEFEHDGDDYGYTEWVNIKPQNIVFINELLQILDKVKGE